ncbi:MAG TPA: carboxymuconolactone decarboxylase family protein [Acidimicrobiales bacterium]|jgi:alkylhydroperoxidase family enzyme|nr:carboxymuconolactone decarboxylase family protein [Acidimicrobiales bacterium]
MSPRIPPLPPKEWPEGMRAALAAMRPAHPRHPFPRRDENRSKGLNALGTLAQHPDLATAFHTLTAHVLFVSTLSTRDRELLILRVSALRKSDYEWCQHVVLGRDNGLSDDEIRAIAAGPGAPGWSARDRAMLQACDELVAHARIGGATWDVLAAEFDTQELMDLVFTVGTYDLLAMAFLSFQVEVDDDLPGNDLLAMRDS